MKKILFPTDFSDNANKALQYAMNFANFFDSELHVLHVYDARTTTGSFKSVTTIMREEAEEDMNKTIQTASELIVGKTVLKPRIIKGRAIDVICNLAEQEKMDLIIMGTQGASGLIEVFLGSNTSGVMTSTTVPILAIPKGAIYHPIKEIIFPVDANKVSDYELLKPLLKIAEKYRSNVKVLHMGSEKMVKKFDNENLEFFLKDISHSYFTKATTQNFNNIISEFTYNQKGDMVCMIRRKRGFWESVFHKSTTSKSVFNSPAPLLILHERGLK